MNEFVYCERRKYIEINPSPYNVGQHTVEVQLLWVQFPAGGIIPIKNIAFLMKIEDAASKQRFLFF